MNEDRAARYHRLRRRATVLSMAAGAAWLVVFLASGWSAALAARVHEAAGSLRWPLARAIEVAICTAVVALGWEVVSLPFTLYRNLLLERKYGLSFEPFATWMRDHLKALAVGFGMSLVAALAVYGAIQVAGAAWWLAATALFAVAGLLLSRIAPVLLLPLFYQFRPLDRDGLRERLLRLSLTAGVPVLGAFEWGLGEKTRRANAALVGAGRTRRILVSDTLLKDYTDDEIEVILAHEIAHHVHHDMWTALALETLVVGAALLVAHVAVTRAGGAPSDLAALPLMMLAGGAVSLLLTPLGNAWSRYHERRADRFALRLTGQPAAFISAMRRLGAQNLAEERPSAPVRWFFHTHPTIDQRIAAAKEFKAA